MKTSLVIAMVSSFLFSNEDPQRMLDKQYDAYITAQAFNPSGVEKYKNRIINTDRPLPKSARLFIDTNIDWDLYAKSTLGSKVWEAFSNKQRQNFKILLRKVHLKKYGKYFSSDIKFSAKFNGPTKYKLLRGHEFAKVETTLSSTTRDIEFDVDFIFHRGQDRWALCDIYIDGVSKSKTYRSQIKKIYKKDGYDGVMSAFKRALNKA